MMAGGGRNDCLYKGENTREGLYIGIKKIKTRMARGIKRREEGRREGGIVYELYYSTV